MAYTGINSGDRLVQATFAEHLEQVLGWDSVYAWSRETFGADGTLGRASTREVVLARNMRLALPNAAFIGFNGTPLFKHDERLAPIGATPARTSA